MAEENAGAGNEAGSEEEVKIEGTTTLTDGGGEGEPNSGDKKSDEDTSSGKAGEKTDHDTDEKSKDGEADKDKDGALTEYAEFTVPEGMVLNEEAAAVVAPMLLDLKATQEQAQGFVDLYAKGIQEALGAQAQTWTDKKASWQAASQDDAEYGKGKYDASLNTAKAAIRAIGGSKLMQALEETQMGSHPEVIRAFWKIGLAIGEDTVDFGKVNTGEGKTLAERLFPNQGKEKAA